MAYYEFPYEFCSFSLMDNFSTEYSSDSNISLYNVLSVLKPDSPTTNLSIGTYLRSEQILYGSLVVQTGGSVSLTATNISDTVAAGETHYFSNLVLGDSSLTMVATATYPYTFAGWYNGGTLLESGTTLTLTSSTYQSVTTFTATFSTTHTSP